MGRVNQKNLLKFIMDFESGNINLEATAELFSYLVQTGQAWTLQGTYGRTAMDLINAGIINRNGRINRKKLQEMGL
jgi:hypothetical protein